MNKIVAITGVSGGIGNALATNFIKNGYKVLGIDLNNHCPEGVIYYQCDLTDDQSCLIAFKKIQLEHPEISIWINNAGLARLGEFSSVSQENFDQVMAINFRAQVTACRFWLKVFEEKGLGQIVNMASAAGIVPAGDMTSYVASKHAVVGFTRALQLELDERHSPVTVSLVTPGFVETQIMQIGAPSGFPAKFKSLISSPESCAKEIVEGILLRHKEITPTLSGKVMTGLYKLPFGNRLAAIAYKSAKKTRT